MPDYIVMRKFYIAFVLIAVVVLSGCTKNTTAPNNTQTTLPVSNSSSTLADVCSGEAGEATKYVLGVDGEGLDRVDAIFFLASKCNVFARCKVDSKDKIFNLYTKNMNAEDEKKLFRKINLTASIGLQTETDENNRTTLIVGNKTYDVMKFEANKSIRIEGKTIGLGGEIELNGYKFLFYQYRDMDEPWLNALIIETDDIKDVLVPSDNTQVYRTPEGFGRFSISVKISDNSAKRIADLVQNVPIIFDISAKEAKVKAKINYYADKYLLGTVQLPANIKEVAVEPYIIIQAVEDTYKEGVDKFNWLLTGLKLQIYPEIKILSTEKVDCRDAE